ncbi:MAG: hypothetical protein ACMXYD_04170 [Candidatus Woesearchaeota archaeon]
MKWLFALLVVVLFASCSSADLTGLAVGPVYTEQGVLLTYSVLDDQRVPVPTRLFVRGDLVGKELFVGSERFEVSGVARSDGLVRGSSSVVVFLDPGAYEVSAVSCSESFFSLECSQVVRTIRI